MMKKEGKLQIKFISRTKRKFLNDKFFFDEFFFLQFLNLISFISFQRKFYTKIKSEKN